MDDAREFYVAELRKLFADPELDEEKLEELVSEFAVYKWRDDEYESEKERAEKYKADSALIELLRSKVQPWKNTVDLPFSTRKPDGQLEGIGFVYDEDRDDRVLLAIHQINPCLKPYIVAVAEHEGMIEVYSTAPTEVGDIHVCGDIWGITEYVLYGDDWVEYEVSSLWKLCSGPTMNTKTWKEHEGTL